MRLVTTSLAALLVAAPVTGCSVVSGDDDGKPGVAAIGSGGERHYSVADFDKVALIGAGDVDVRTGQGFGLTVTGDAATLDGLKVTQDGSTLALGFKRGVHWTNGKTLRWVVTMPRIVEANIAGSGTMRVDKVEGGNFTGNIGGSGTIDVAGLKVDKASFSVGGSGDISAAGAARNLDLSIDGSGKLRATPLTVETANVSIMGAGNVDATVTKHADVTIMGAGDVTIAGGAQCAVTKMGGGNVRCG